MQSSSNPKNTWQEFVEKEIKYFQPILNILGFGVDADQPHTKGERGSFRAKKIILLGKRLADNIKVVIKCARYGEGANELLEEKQSRENIKKIDFAYHEFLEPNEIYFYTGLAPSPYQGEGRGEVVIQITEFIQEEKKFTERDPKEQFDLIYKSFVVQEGVHAVTAKHNKLIKKLFRTFDFENYSKLLYANKLAVLDFLAVVPLASLSAGEGPRVRPVLGELLDQVEQEIIQNKHTISQFCDFLTHTDFVPHNFRVKNENGTNKIYLLDHSAIVVGNKHDGWARFLNWSVLHAPILETWFKEYFEINRSVEENKSLRLMRLLRLFELSAHHAKIYFDSKKENNSSLAQLSGKRVFFWLEVMRAVYENREVDKQIVEDYKSSRDSLRTQSEKERQQIIY